MTEEIINIISKKYQEDILRRSKLIRGNEGVPGNPGIAMMGSQVAPALHITEDTSRRSREHRAELLRFMKEVRKVKGNEFSLYFSRKVCLFFPK